MKRSSLVSKILLLYSIFSVEVRRTVGQILDVRFACLPTRRSGENDTVRCDTYGTDSDGHDYDVRIKMFTLRVIVG